MAKSYLRHPDNFFTGTRTLTLEQRGAYNDLLDLYISFDGVMLDNCQQIARQLAVDLRVWRRIRGELIAAGKLEIRGTYLVPTGAATTLARCLATSVAGRKAADSRWHKHGSNPLEEQETNDATANATAMPSRQDNTRHITPTEAAPSVWDYPVRYLTQHGTSEKAARSLIGKWLKTSSPEKIIAVVLAAQKNQVAELIGKTHHLILYRGAVTGAHPFDYPGIHR